MLVTTTNTLPTHDIHRVVGQVVGVVALRRNPYVEGIRSLSGRINPDAAAILSRRRQEAVRDLTERADRRGANAVVGMRFHHRQLSATWTEICAYGTGVVAVPKSQPSVYQSAVHLLQSTTDQDPAKGAA